MIHRERIGEVKLFKTGLFIRMHDSRVSSFVNEGSLKLDGLPSSPGEIMKWRECGGQYAELETDGLNGPALSVNFTSQRQ